MIIKMMMMVLIIKNADDTRNVAAERYGTFAVSDNGLYWDRSGYYLRRPAGNYQNLWRGARKNKNAWESAVFYLSVAEIAPGMGGKSGNPPIHLCHRWRQSKLHMCLECQRSAGTISLLMTLWIFTSQHRSPERAISGGAYVIQDMYYADGHTYSKECVRHHEVAWIFQKNVAAERYGTCGQRQCIPAHMYRSP